MVSAGTGEKPTEIQRAHIRAQKVTAQEQPTQEQPENYLVAAEQTTEQNYNMIDGQINNTPTVAELEAKVKAGETISLVDLAEAVKADKERGKAVKTEKKPSIRRNSSRQRKDRTEKSGKNKKITN